jgi:hypothetical protein
MSAPTREQRVLDQMQTILQAGEARLASMFALFTHLARDEPMPGPNSWGPGPGGRAAGRIGCWPRACTQPVRACPRA